MGWSGYLPKIENPTTPGKKQAAKVKDFKQINRVKLSSGVMKFNSFNMHNDFGHD